jgi:hypothetical protein
MLNRNRPLDCTAVLGFAGLAIIVAKGEQVVMLLGICACQLLVFVLEPAVKYWLVATSTSSSLPTCGDRSGHWS